MWSWRSSSGAAATTNWPVHTLLSVYFPRRSALIRRLLKIRSNLLVESVQVTVFPTGSAPILLLHTADCWCSSSPGFRPGQRTRRGESIVFTRTPLISLFGMDDFFCVGMFKGQMYKKQICSCLRERKRKVACDIPCYPLFYMSAFLLVNCYLPQASTVELKKDKCDLWYDLCIHNTVHGKYQNCGSQIDLDLNIQVIYITNTQSGNEPPAVCWKTFILGFFCGGSFIKVLFWKWTWDHLYLGFMSHQPSLTFPEFYCQTESLLRRLCASCSSSWPTGRSLFQIPGFVFVVFILFIFCFKKKKS